MINQHVRKEEFIPTYEIDIEVRDSQGNPTGKRKQFSSIDAYKISEFYLRHQGMPKRKKKSKAVSDKEATEVLNTDQELQAMYEKREETLKKLEGEQPKENV